MQRLAGAREVAATTLAIPHPYPDGAAEEWISGHEGRDDATFAIERREDGALVGAIGLRMERAHDRAELGYWIGVPYWGHGYATEAARAVVRYGFETEGLNRIFAFHFVSNPASGRVLEKIGMRKEGVFRSHTRKWDQHMDDACYGIVRAEWSVSE